jgi:hypothetical protein
MEIGIRDYRDVSDYGAPMHPGIASSNIYLEALMEARVMITPLVNNVEVKVSAIYCKEFTTDC